MRISPASPQYLNVNYRPAPRHHLQGPADDATQQQSPIADPHQPAKALPEPEHDEPAPSEPSDQTQQSPVQQVGNTIAVRGNQLCQKLREMGVYSRDALVAAAGMASEKGAQLMDYLRQTALKVRDRLAGQA